MSASTPLRLYLFGAFRIEIEMGLIRLPRRKVEALLAYLVLHPEPHAREKLAALFWGDFSDRQARASLRTSLNVLRKALGDTLLFAEQDTVQINLDLPLWVDAREFQQNVEFARDVRKVGSQSAVRNLQSAVALYLDDLLSDFYDDWVLSLREHYRRLYLDILLGLTQHIRSQSEYGHAIEFAHKVLAVDMANERAHQHLMFCYLASSDRTAALAQYEKCQRALREELAVEPAPETTALYQWIKQTPSEAPSLAARITNLPIPLTSFIGRTRETKQVKELISPARLVTLTGAGGSGKTRLAIQVGTDLIDAFKDGVWWVELAALNDETLVPQAVAKALGVRETPNQPLIETLTNFVREKALLLLIDNCEHLLTACAQLSETLLRGCAHLKILTTSRETLGVSGETVWPVPTLAVPVPQALSLTDLLMQYEGVRLFVERAAAVHSDFALTEQNALAVTQICRRLDGIPLAIELAAARVKVLTPDQIAARLDDRFNLLTVGSRTALPRQQTLRAAIDWSYDLLNDDERVLFRRLSVFAGGWTLQAAESVCAGDPLERATVLNPLSHLVDKSLVVVEARNGESRYGMLETIREYAREKQVESGEAPDLQAKHATRWRSQRRCGWPRSPHSSPPSSAATAAPHPPAVRGCQPRPLRSLDVPAMKALEEVSLDGFGYTQSADQPGARRTDHVLRGREADGVQQIVVVVKSIVFGIDARNRLRQDAGEQPIT